MTQSWTKQKVLDGIQALHKRKARMNSTYMQTHNLPLWGAAQKRFGNWRKAVEAAGIDYTEVMVNKHYRKWSKIAVITEIKRRHKEGLPLNMVAIQKEDSGLYFAIRKYFGESGLRVALIRSGIDPNEVTLRVKWKKGVIVGEIKRLFLEGTPLSFNFLRSNGHEQLVIAARKRFGSWRKAIEAAGLDYWKVPVIKRGYWDRRKILAEIRRLNRSGVRLSSHSIQYKNGSLFTAAQRKFGSWSQAVYAAGIDYLKHSHVWSSRAWLRKLSQAEVVELERRADALNELHLKHKGRRRR
jgi:hypothetical protein